MGKLSNRMQDVSLSRQPEIYLNPNFNKHGTQGQEVELLTNFFRIKRNQSDELYQYHVYFKPEIDNKNTKKRLLNEHRDIIGRVKAFDGMVLYSKVKLPKKEIDLVSKTKEGEFITINIRFTSLVVNNSPQMIQIFNVIMKRIYHLIGMQLVGRNYYNPKKAYSIQKHKLDIWPGFTTSVNLYEDKILFQADISHKILRSDTVLDLMYELMKHSKTNFRSQLSRKIIGQIVLTRYNNKTYKIDDINWSATPNSTFSRRNTNVSYIDYYRDQYEINIRDTSQPMLISNPVSSNIKNGQDMPIFLVPELCNLTGLSEEAMSDFSIMRDIAVYTRIPPQQRRATLRDFMNTIQGNKDVQAELDGWGLKFDDNLLNIKARVMKPEIIRQQQSEIKYRPHDAEWSNLTKGQKMSSSVHLQRWAIVYITKNSGIAKTFYQTLSKLCKPLGFSVEQPKWIGISDDRTQSFMDGLRECNGAQLVCCIVPSRLKDRYDAIKKYCCITKGMLSQIIFSGTISKPQMLISITTKIAVQLNCKLGGEAWTVDIPLNNLMVVGYDTYHDSVNKNMSVGGFVASLNKSLTKYYSRCTFQHNAQELLDRLLICMIDALKEYYQVNKNLPDRIIIYRDGVGDGQLDVVSNYEASQFHAAFEKFGQNYKPQVAIIIVKKRINHRFFTQKNQQLSNPPPGTIIDNDVTKNNWYDFFVVSQSVRQGCVTPTSYNVISDSTGLKADHLQRLTYKLCHLYFNWPGTVRVPAPCQYAHKLAFITGQSLHCQADVKLVDKLYYI